MWHRLTVLDYFIQSLLNKNVIVNESMNISYIINILGEEGNEEINPVTPPIYQTSKFYFKTVEQFRNAISDEKKSLVYSQTLAIRLKNKFGFGSTEFHVLRASYEKSILFLFYLTTFIEFRIKAESKMSGFDG